MSDVNSGRANNHRKTFLVKALSHPLLGLMGVVGSIASLVSIPLAIYFYSVSKADPLLTYYTNPVKAVVVRAGQASRLKASYDNKVIDSDITAAQVALWNRGTKAIKKPDVLKPVVIYTENKTPILEATIRKVSREVIKLALNTDELQEGRVTVSWDILEHDDGGIIQLIYAGDANLGIRVDGVIEGQKDIMRTEFSEQLLSPDEQYKSAIRTNRILGYLALAIGLLMGIFISSILYRQKRDHTPFDLSDKLVPILPLILIGMAIYLLFIKAGDPGPPFGF